MDEKIRLPQAFLDRMKRLLGTEYDEFIASYGKERYYGLRRNPLKASEEAFLGKMPFALEPVGWAREGYYYQAQDHPGRHVLHEAGAYYMQEPSAMAVVQILDPRPGEYILDLCAAPGGKSTQTAGRMKGEGLLVSNEIIPGRAKILSQNIERMGVRNCVVCNETPERMASFFPAFFDRIVVDAPCSGEGMFRKDEAAAAEWSEEQVAVCARRQYGILTEAAKMLRDGGVLVYSTCTFAPEENEGVISRFLREHEDFTAEEIPRDEAFAAEEIPRGEIFAAGRLDWVDHPVQGVERTVRLMPHRLKGEGHYIARLRKGGPREDVVRAGTVPMDKKSSKLDCEILPIRYCVSWQTRKMPRDFLYNKKVSKPDCGICLRQTRNILTNLADRVQDFLTEELGLDGRWLEKQQGTVKAFGDQIYLVPEGMIPMEGLKVARFGLHLGTDKKNRIEPAHALAMALGREETERVWELTEEEAGRYLAGESFPCPARKGWTLLTYEGYPLGFGKAANGQMKNHYPKGLRR